MAILRIYDLKENVLALDLRDLLRLLTPRSLQATWTFSTVKSSKPGHEWFEATGDGGEQLEELAQDGARREVRVGFIEVCMREAAANCRRKTITIFTGEELEHNPTGVKRGSIRLCLKLNKLERRSDPIRSKRALTKDGHLFLL